MNRSIRMLKRAGLATIFTGMLLVVGVAFAAWTATGTGSGYAEAATVSALTTVDVSASTTAQLYPGGTGDVVLRVSNPNTFPVTVTGVSGNGAAATISMDAACDASTGVSFTNVTGLTVNVPAGGTADITLAGGAAMSGASVNACQGETFSIPVTLSGTVG